MTLGGEKTRNVRCGTWKPGQGCTGNSPFRAIDMSNELYRQALESLSFRPAMATSQGRQFFAFFVKIIDKYLIIIYDYT